MLIIKGKAGTINLIFTADTTPEMMLSDIRKEERFLKDADCKVTYSGINLSYEEEMLFEKTLREISERITLVKKRSLSEDAIKYSLMEGERILLAVEGNVRGGEVVKSRGDLIVYGDVNPSALVVARGNITVLGALRGSAHVEENGRVYATYMSPTQVKIGNVCSYNKNSENVGSAVALAENGEIILESL